MPTTTNAPRYVASALGIFAVIAVASLAWLLVGIVNDTPEQDRYLAEMKENLNGHPDSPRYHLVSESTLIHEGVVACEWLAKQPAGPSVLDDDELRDLYFDRHPRAHSDGWPFKNGRTDLREEILTNSWGWLCAEKAQDHRADPPPGDGD
jgi:hypothetical protein